MVGSRGEAPGRRRHLCMNWDSVMAAHLDAERRERLAGACVGLAGAGGLGSNCAALLARCGVGRLVVVDFDVVSVSNLNRQHFLPEHVGRPKVEALKDMLGRINPDVRVDARCGRLDRDNVAEMFCGCAPVVEAVDAPEAKSMIVEHCLRAGLFVIGASGMAGWGGPAMECRTFGSRAVIVGDGRYGVSRDMPVLAPRVMMAAAMQADQVLGYLLGACPGMEG